MQNCREDRSMTLLFHGEKERTAERSMEDHINNKNRRTVADDVVALVDPFIGTEPVDLPSRSGIAATWFWPKPQIGNTHPGACLPLGWFPLCRTVVAIRLVTVVMPNHHGYPPRLKEDLQISGLRTSSSQVLGLFENTTTIVESHLFLRRRRPFNGGISFRGHSRGGCSWVLYMYSQAIWYSC